MIQTMAPYTHRDLGGYFAMRGERLVSETVDVVLGQ
jgi:hypothetical protein